MKLHVDIRTPILAQFAQQLGTSVVNDQFSIDSQMGRGRMIQMSFPNQVELYHLTFTLHHPLQIYSQNPAGSNWWLLNINLSAAQVDKEVNQQPINLQRHTPAGMLLYPPQTEVFSESPPKVPFEIALVRFPHSLLTAYGHESIAQTIPPSAVLYEDLDFQSEDHLRKAIQATSEPLIAHAHVLAFLGIFWQKMARREKGDPSHRLHPEDMKGLFMAASQLRDPASQSLPTVEQLAKAAGMGQTKFKAAFKQVFGTSPRKYNTKIKLEYAKDQLVAGHRTPSEISYQLGYAHPSKFTHAFKKHFGVLPSELSGSDFLG